MPGRSGITPAYAGSTSSHLVADSHIRDHPCLRGGAHHRRVRLPELLRITPAYAGSALIHHAVFRLEALSVIHLPCGVDVAARPHTLRHNDLAEARAGRAVFASVSSDLMSATGCVRPVGVSWPRRSRPAVLVVKGCMAALGAVVIGRRGARGGPAGAAVTPSPRHGER